MIHSPLYVIQHNIRPKENNRDSLLFNLSIIIIKKTAVDTLLMMITSSIHDLTYAVVVKYVKVRIHILLFVCFILCI